MQQLSLGEIFVADLSVGIGVQHYHILVGVISAIAVFVINHLLAFSFLRF
jgi:hypothetical protein